MINISTLHAKILRVSTIVVLAGFTRNIFCTIFLSVSKWVECILMLMFTLVVEICQKDQTCRWQKWAKNLIR